jgi:hypothetical protein
MTTGNTDVIMNNILTEIATRIGKSYELEADFIDTIKQIVKDACATYNLSAKSDTTTTASTTAPAKKTRAKKEVDPNKGPRKVTPYNVYMQEQSVVEKEKGTPANQRLAEIGSRSKLLNDEQKKVYKTMADAKNAASGATTVNDTASVATAP